MRRLLAAIVLSALPFLGAPAHAEKLDNVWHLLTQPGFFGMMRHATAPGGGDPAGFRLDDCTTQRNLSDGGRDEARAIGRMLAGKGLAKMRVRSSQWCRCLETAHLLDLGTVEPWPLLNSFFGTPEKGPAQTAALVDALKTYDLDTPLLLVTHHTVIIGVTSIAPSSGEIVVVRRDTDGTLHFAGRIPPQR
jgi:phosphohistidine phosphatase SixA